MRNIKSFIYEIVSVIRLDSFFDDMKLVNAYPFQAKPTQLRYPVISICMGNMNLTSAEIGAGSRAGSVSLFVDIYIPFNYSKSDMCEIFSHICASLDDYCIEKISSQRVEADKLTSCYVMKNEFVFNDRILFGGEDGE